MNIKTIANYAGMAEIYSVATTVPLLIIWNVLGSLPCELSVLFSFILFCSVLFSSVLFSSTLFSSVLCCSTLFHSVLFRSLLFCSVLCCSTLFHSLLFCSVLFCCVPFCPPTPMVGSGYSPIKSSYWLIWQSRFSFFFLISAVM